MTSEDDARLMVVASDDVERAVREDGRYDADELRARCALATGTERRRIHLVSALRARRIMRADEDGVVPPPHLRQTVDRPTKKRNCIRQPYVVVMPRDRPLVVGIDVGMRTFSLCAVSWASTCHVQGVHAPHVKRPPPPPVELPRIEAWTICSASPGDARGKHYDTAIRWTLRSALETSVDWSRVARVAIERQSWTSACNVAIQYYMMGALDEMARRHQFDVVVQSGKDKLAVYRTEEGRHDGADELARMSGSSAERSYRVNKVASIYLARRLLQHCAEVDIRDFFEANKKQDDLSDAFLHALCASGVYVTASTLRAESARGPGTSTRGAGSPSSGVSTRPSSLDI